MSLQWDRKENGEKQREREIEEAKREEGERKVIKLLLEAYRVKSEFGKEAKK